MSYGKELIVDLHRCSVATFTKESISTWFNAVCEIADMKPIRKEWWEEYGNDEPHLNGITAVQFISTSSITVHACTDLRQAHINFFTCKDFNAQLVLGYTKNWFLGEVVSAVTLERP